MWMSKDKKPKTIAFLVFFGLQKIVQKYFWQSEGIIGQNEPEKRRKRLEKEKFRAFCEDLQEQSRGPIMFSMASKVSSGMRHL